MADSPANPARFALNLSPKAVRAGALRLSNTNDATETVYVDLLVGAGAPNGSYGRDSSATMLYIRNDASTIATGMYLTVNGGQAWTAFDPTALNSLDLNGTELILDADADTSITADTDDQIDVKISGADDFRFTANLFSVLSGSALFFADSAGAKFGDANDLVMAWDGTKFAITQAAPNSAIHLGVSGAGIDLCLFGDTAGRDVTWDQSADSLLFADSAKLVLGTGSDITFLWDGTDLLVSQAAPDSIVKWGVSGAGINHVFYGDTAGRDLTWDQTNDQLLFADSAKLSIGSGGGVLGDISFSWDGTRMNVNQLTPDSEIRWGIDGAGIDQRWYGDTAGAYLLWDQSADALTRGGAAVDLHTQAGTGTGTVIRVIGPDLTHGMKTVVFENTVTPAAIETTLFTLPANSVIDCVQANIEADLTAGGTTTTVSIGITGDVDKWGTIFAAGVQSNSLLKNSKINAIGTPASPPQPGSGVGEFQASAVAVKLIGAANGGATAGNTALSVGSVKVRIVYRTAMSLADAA